MTRSITVACLTLFAVVVIVGTALDTAQGAVQAIAWACHTVGTTAVAVVSAFLAGGALVHAAHRGAAARRPLPDAPT
jgi:hypothetical protein